MLVAAFRATLEEVLEADVIIHVRDISQTDSDAQKHDVETVLRQLGIDADGGAHLIEVWNKIDRFDAAARERLANMAALRPKEVRPHLVSAVTGEGLEALLAAIEDRLAASKVTMQLLVDAGDGAAMSWLHRHTEVLDKHLDEGSYTVTVRVDEDRRDAVVQRFGMAALAQRM
jgi:GTP-binding protein HflX